MKAAVVALLALSSAASARMEAVPAHADLLRRQATAPTSSTTPSSRSRAQHSSTLVVGAPTSVAASATTAAAGAGGHVASSPLASLSKIGTSTTAEATQALPTTYAAGATVPVAGAPNLPSLATLNPASYPPLDHIPPLDSPEMEEWLSEIDWDSVPDIEPTAPGGCANASNADALANAGPDGACWWTCGGCTRATDITYCPTKEDWGASFDDGPSPYTPRLLNLLDQQNLKSTFFIVGSRAISRPEMLQYEYASGHQISIHTWAHSSLTTLSNEEIVAELGWTKKVIKEITGVTPNTMRPPYGDIDDRVRSIALQMGLRPIIWTQADGQQFDTRDWQIGGGVVSAPDVYNNFERFLSSASSHLSTGFIVLAHDLYQQSVDLAVDYILPGVINEGKLKIKTISECLGEPLSQAYIETNDNSTSLLQTTATVVGATGAGFVPGIGSTASGSKTSASGSRSSSPSASAGADNQSTGTSSASGTSSAARFSPAFALTGAIGAGLVAAMA